MSDMTAEKKRMGYEQDLNDEIMRLRAELAEAKKEIAALKEWIWNLEAKLAGGK